MTKETRNERARRLKRERSRKEMEYELSRDLKSEEDKREMQEIEQQYRNKYADKALLFFSTLALLYLLFFLAYRIFIFFFGTAISLFGISINFIYPLIHGAIWVAAIISVYRGRSVLDDIVDRLI